MTLAKLQTHLYHSFFIVQPFQTSLWMHCAFSSFESLLHTVASTWNATFFHITQCVCDGASLHQLTRACKSNFQEFCSLAVHTTNQGFLGFFLELVFKHLPASLCICCFLSGSPFNLKPFPPRRLPHYLPPE